MRLGASDSDSDEEEEREGAEGAGGAGAEGAVAGAGAEVEGPEDAGAWLEGKRHSNPASENAASWGSKHNGHKHSAPPSTVRTDGKCWPHHQTPF